MFHHFPVVSSRCVSPLCLPVVLPLLRQNLINSVAVFNGKLPGSRRTDGDFYRETAEVHGIIAIN